MRGRSIRVSAVAAVAATAALAGSSTVGAATAGKICPSFKQNSRTYYWNTVGSAFTCSSGKPWVQKLVSVRVNPNAAGNVKLTNGPRGYKCFASVWTRTGVITLGICYRNTLAYPGSGLSWSAR